ncbi:two-component sensor histidine kinase [Rheinheimera sp. YQF-2]|uniref:histidine kinase n=1 Tax=Rheinheimera lutimaris TaxID=2740584 RepID=A0A7Y5ANG4_9GAMM|nr:ATP-binding protein [Rheinheimera lutimaris]NRQ41637.1 two-component sensor histidine kinase [Rheinheimera lutimaris]
MQRLFWHFYLFLFLVLLGIGWAVEQLWQQWQPATAPPWLESYTSLLQQQVQQPQSSWPHSIKLPFSALPGNSIGWLAQEQQQLQRGEVLALFEDNQVYFYYLQQQQLWRFGPLPLTQNDGATWFTLLFFLLLAIAVALWLWPVARDIRRLQHSLQRFADNRDIALTLPARSFIAPIAQSFADMSDRIRDLLNLQREMTHAVSHELRTPIARLSFALEMAQQLPAQERQLMLQDVRELQQLVDEILDYARLETGQLPLQLQQINLIELINNVQEKLAPLPGADIRLQLPASALLYADGHYLERALQNVLVNAKKYAQQHIQLTLTEYKQHWQISVDDDGPGVPPELRHQILQPFFRIEASRNKQAGGFGLGLAIVQRVMQWHQGSVTVTDSAQGGARFVLALPQRHAAKL